MCRQCNKESSFWTKPVSNDSQIDKRGICFKRNYKILWLTFIRIGPYPCHVVLVQFMELLLIHSTFPLDVVLENAFRTLGYC